jgi:2-polyprenyl-3-methyl-5-hydroxy-6-metoxy-1,4-benzoquinol methylase
MDERIHRIAASANVSAYDPETARKYIDGAPHIKHASLRSFYADLVIQVYDAAKEHTTAPRVLDLGAGEGAATLPFLELGARVTAVDISRNQLDILRNKCDRFGDKLEVRCEDVIESLNKKDAEYDIIAANSFLHHIPDYLGMIAKAINLLTPWGQFFSFQDPL